MRLQPLLIRLRSYWSLGTKVTSVVRAGLLVIGLILLIHSLIPVLLFVGGILLFFHGEQYYGLALLLLGIVWLPIVAWYYSRQVRDALRAVHLWKKK